MYWKDFPMFCSHMSVYRRGQNIGNTFGQHPWPNFSLRFCLHQNQKECNKPFVEEINAGCLCRRVLLTETRCSAVFLCSFWKCVVSLLCEWCDLKPWNGGMVLMMVQTGLLADGYPPSQNQNYSFCSESRNNGINTFHSNLFFLLGI